MHMHFNFHKVFFMQSLPLYISCSFMVLNDDTVDIKKPDVIFSYTFVVDEFSGLFLHPSIVSVKHSRPTKLTNCALSFYCL